MKFKVGDRVRIISPNFAHGKTGYVECVGGGWSSTLRYAVLLDDVGTYRFSEIELELIGSSTERRLIEALRPFAESADSCEKANLCVSPAKRHALNLLRELGEHPETCKECGQEIRK